MIVQTRLRTAVAVVLAAGALMLRAACPAFATGAEPATPPQVDPAPCVAAAAADDADTTVAACTPLIESEKTLKADRIKALIARSGAYQRQGLIERAIGDYDVALRIDPTVADNFNARGELWRKQGDRSRALADFGAAIKLNPDHLAAKASYKWLAQELERLGVQIAVAGKPSFICATARRAVEKAICADPELANLDREIHDMNIQVIKDNMSKARSVRELRRAQEAFIARRNAEYGRPGYDLRKAMKARLREIVGVDGY